MPEAAAFEVLGFLRSGGDAGDRFDREEDRDAGQDGKDQQTRTQRQAGKDPVPALSDRFGDGFSQRHEAMSP